MKPREIKAARTRLGYKQKYMAEQLGVCLATYRKKEDGNNAFTAKEIAMMSNILQLKPDEINQIFFDGNLPLGN